MTLHNGGRETALNTSVRRRESGIQFSSAFLPRVGARRSQAVVACLRRTRLTPATPGKETEPGLIVYRFGSDLFYSHVSVCTLGPTWTDTTSRRLWARRGFSRRSTKPLRRCGVEYLRRNQSDERSRWNPCGGCAESWCRLPGAVSQPAS